MTLLNFVTPLRLGVEGKGAWPAVAVYGMFNESALADPKPRRPFRVDCFVPVGDGAQPTYRLDEPIVINVLDSQLASIQGGVAKPEWTQPLP